MDTCCCYAQSSRWCTAGIFMEIANVGDPRLGAIAVQLTACHCFISSCLPAGLQWKTLLLTAWRKLLNWLCAKSLRTRLMLPPNFSTRYVRNSEISQTSHLRESLTLRLPYVNYLNWASHVGPFFWHRVWWAMASWPPFLGREIRDNAIQPITKLLNKKGRLPRWQSWQCSKGGHQFHASPKIISIFRHQKRTQN